MENIQDNQLSNNTAGGEGLSPSYNAAGVKPCEKPPIFKAVIAWCTLALGFEFNHFVVNYFGGIWGGVFWLLFGVLGAVYVVKSGVKLSGFQIALFVVAVVFCFTPLFCASRFINFLAAVFSFILFFYLAAVLAGAEPFGRRFLADLFLSLLVRPFEKFADCVKAAFSVFKGSGKAKYILYAAVGLAIAFPLTAVVVALLVSSDARFEELMKSALDNLPDFSFSIIFEILFAVPVAMYLFGSFSSVEKRVESGGYNPDKLRVIPTVITYFAVTPIGIFYVAYIITQVLNIAQALNSTLNYSEFARRGFFELCAITVINLGVIAIIQTFSARTRLLKGYIIALSVLSLGVTATALVKMGMYIKQYGMTLLRVYTTWFMLVICIAFVLLILLQIKEYKFWRVLFFAFTAMFFALCFSNVDGGIARYNLWAYESGKIEEIDVSQFRELGYSAVISAEKLYYDEDYSDYELTAYLRDISEKDESEDKFAYFSIPRARAQVALERIEAEGFNPNS